MVGGWRAAALTAGSAAASWSRPSAAARPAAARTAACPRPSRMAPLGDLVAPGGLELRAAQRFRILRREACAIAPFGHTSRWCDGSQTRAPGACDARACPNGPRPSRRAHRRSSRRRARCGSRELFALPNPTAARAPIRRRPGSCRRRARRDEPGAPGGGLVRRDADATPPFPMKALMKVLPRRRRQRHRGTPSGSSRSAKRLIPGVQCPPGERWPRRRWQVRVGGHAGKLRLPAPGPAAFDRPDRGARSWHADRASPAHRGWRGRGPRVRRRSVRLSRPPPASAACSAAASSGAKAAGGSASPSWTSRREPLRGPAMAFEDPSARSSGLPPACTAGSRRCASSAGSACAAAPRADASSPPCASNTRWSGAGMPTAAPISW